MPKQQKREYTQEQREEALVLYKEVGPGEAGRRLHIPAKTISSWASDAGIQSDAPARTKAAVEQAQLNNAKRRELIAQGLYEESLAFIQRLKEGETTHKGQMAVEVYYENIQPESAVAWIKAVQGAVQTAELLSGKATSRTENVSRDEKEQKLAQILPLVQVK